MATATLLQVSQLSARLGFDAGLTVVNEALREALIAATVQIEADLRTPLALAAYSEIFYVTESMLHGNRYSQPLRLRAGFVVASPALTVKIAARIEDLSSADDVASSAIIDRPSGTVLIHGSMKDQYIEVAYSAGFTANGSVPPYFDDVAVPDWLREVGAMTALLKLESAPQLFGKDYQKLQFKDLRIQRESVMNRYVRYLPGHLPAIV